MDVKPGLALCKRQIVGCDAYGITILLVPSSYTVWKPPCDLIVEEGDSRGASEPWARIRPEWVEGYVVNDLANECCERLSQIQLKVVTLVATGLLPHQDNEKDTEQM